MGAMAWGAEVGEEGRAPGRGGEGGVRGGGGKEEVKIWGTGGRGTRKKKGEKERQMEEGAKGEVSRRGNDSKVEGLRMSYISLWQCLYRRARPVASQEPPFGISSRDSRGSRKLWS